MPTCPDCGESVRPGDRYCMGCGTDLRDATNHPESDEEGARDDANDGDEPANADPDASTPADAGHEAHPDADPEADPDADSVDDASAPADADTTQDGDEGEADTGDAPDAPTGEATTGETTTDDLGARAAGTVPPDDEEYMAPPGEWTPPDGTDEPERPAVEPLGPGGTLAWAVRTLGEHPAALAPFLVAGTLAAGAALAAYGLAGPAPGLVPRPSPVADLLGTLALVAVAPGPAAAALAAEARVAGDGPGGTALLAAAVRRSRRALPAAVAAGAVTFAGYVFLVLPGLVLGPKVSLSPAAAAVDGTGVVESVERSWRHTRGRLGTVAAVPAAAAAVVVPTFVVAPVAGALVAPLAAAVAGVALARVYLEGG